MNTTSIPLKQLSDQLPTQRQRKRQQPKGRRVDDEMVTEVTGLLAQRFGDAAPRRDLLIEYLHVLNDHYGQLGTPYLAALAKWMKLAQTEVFEVASFYHHFDVVREDGNGELPTPPRLTVRVCDGLSCELAGAKALLAKLPELLQADVRVIAAPCVGRCEQAPVVVVGQKPISHARSAEVALAVAANQCRDEAPASAIRFAQYRDAGGYALLADCLAGKHTVEEIIRLMSDAGLRGLGGAGFPTGRKWGIVRAEPAPRLMAVNIDEGEPGTFKDRVFLERDPHRFLEGMLIAAWAVDVEAIYIYLRDEYHGIRALLEEELTALPAALALTGIPLDRLPPIELRRGAGAYICGEESAMIESIEGKRGMPRLRPPFVAQRGLFNRPTLQHNMETLLWVREILERGPGWFSSHGRNNRTGLRSFSLSGRVNKPGVHIAPAGITLRELVDEYGGGLPEGHTLYGYLPGGASGGIFPERLADVPLDFDTLQPHGGFIGSAAVMVLTRSASHWDRASDAARNLMHFFEDESCGQCTPCRSGTSKARALIAENTWDTALLAELSQVMRDASICGLGQAAPNPVDSVVRYFPEELGLSA
ncbi:MAG: NADH-ubiquinone oxidoreductase-F iron-sulfur binding region domain-containing protein [Ideonella sp.]